MARALRMVPVLYIYIAWRSLHRLVAYRGHRQTTAEPNFTSSLLLNTSKYPTWCVRWQTEENVTTRNNISLYATEYELAETKAATTGP